MTAAWLVGPIALVASYGLAIGSIAHMLRHRRSPGSTMAWLLVLIGLPFVGTALYVLLGGRKLRRERRQLGAIDYDPGRVVPTSWATEFDRVLRDYQVAPSTWGNSVEVIEDGKEAYDVLTRMIEEASQTLYLSTFLFADDETGRDIAQRLTRRARDGVDVRVLVDGAGALVLPRRFFRELIAAGGQFLVFKPVWQLPLLRRMNLRNHRKIVVADGESSFAGGMNIVHEDVFAKHSPSAWEDLSIHIVGPAATHLEQIFHQDWQFATGRPSHSTRSSRNAESRSKVASDEMEGRVQVLASGPDVPNDPMYSGSLTAIFRARERIWLSTPYFVPNDHLVEALIFACQRQVDVRILIPLKSNHPVSDLAGSALLREIQDAGGTVLRYTPSMLHAKAMIVDDDFAAVGSANFDMRSLFLNYELMQICYDAQTIDDVAKWFVNLSNACQSERQQPSVMREIGEGALRALSPLF